MQAPDPRRTPDRCRALWAAPVIILCTATAGADAQVGGRAIASAETELELGPQDLAGHVKGGRGPETGRGPVPLVGAGDWFGGRPYWEWANASGDWGGVRTWFAVHGITFGASYTLDWSGVWSGGVRGVASTRSLWDVNATLDLGTIVGLDGGEVFVDFYSTDGRGGWEDTGDFWGHSSIQTERNVDQVAELWYQQWLLDRSVRVKVGKVDGNAEFGFLECAAGFVNSAPGVSPSLATLPLYPDPAMSVNVFAYPAAWAYVGLGLYDGATQDGIATGGRGPGTFFSDRRSSSWFGIVEAGLTWERLGAMGSGRVAVGAWRHSGRFDRFDGGVERGTGGFYLLAEEQVWRAGEQGEESERGVFGMARYAWADADVSPAAQHVAFGLVLKGTLPDRREDEAGVMLSRIFFSDAPGSGFDADETTLEFFYRIRVTPFVHLTPDVQWIANPSGDRSIDNAVVGAVRLEVDF